MGLREEDLYGGMTRLTVPAEGIEGFGKTNVYQPSNGQLFYNQFVHFKSINGTKSSALGRYDASAGQVVALAPVKKEIWGIQPKNLGQRFAFAILLDHRIPFLPITAPPPTPNT